MDAKKYPSSTTAQREESAYPFPPKLQIFGRDIQKEQLRYHRRRVAVERNLHLRLVPPPALVRGKMQSASRAHVPTHRSGERLRQRNRTGRRFQGSEGDGQGKNPPPPGPSISERGPSSHEHQRRKHDRLDLGTAGGGAEGIGNPGAGASAGGAPAGGDAHQRRDPAPGMEEMSR